VADPLHDDGLPIPSAGATFFGPSGTAISVSQDKTNWCWAAATQMLLRHVGLSEKKQCEIAAKRLDKPCCSEPDDCNVKLAFDLLGILLTENGVSSTRARAQLEEGNFWDELFLRRPILLAEIFDNGCGWSRPRRVWVATAS